MLDPVSIRRLGQVQTQTHDFMVEKRGLLAFKIHVVTLRYNEKEIRFKKL
jgi:hypothetical protein